MNNLIKRTIRELRRRQTESESILWQELRNRKLLGKKFLRQHPIIVDWKGKSRFFVADFYCHEDRLVIEIDGEIHNRQKDYDEARECVLKSMGLKILRFRNDLVTKNLNAVIEMIEGELTC